MLQTATLQCRQANTGFAIVALLAVLSGCASTGTHAPRTSQEAVAGAVVGTLGAAGGAVAGVGLGALAGLQCGQAVIVCAPVMAVMVGVKGATMGGEAGAEAGVKWTRGATMPGSDTKSPDDSRSTGEPTASTPTTQPIVEH